MQQKQHQHDIYKHGMELFGIQQYYGERVKLHVISIVILTILGIVEVDHVMLIHKHLVVQLNQLLEQYGIQ
jgi:hypothetical protein